MSPYAVNYCPQPSVLAALIPGLRVLLNPVLSIQAILDPLMLLGLLLSGHA
jgi:hypothetical protein